MSQQADVQDVRRRILATGIRVGTQVKTKFMAQFVTRASPEGIYEIDTDVTLARIRTAARFISRVGADGLIVCSGKEYANTPVEKFCAEVGATPKLGRFMPGTLTNPSLPYYIEPRLLLVSDPQVDEQAVTEATNAGIPVIGISNTDNITSRLDVVIPANNRGRKSLATVYWLLARDVLTERGEMPESGEMGSDIDDYETKIAEEAPAE